jgi:general secretion pathway protein H
MIGVIRDRWEKGKPKQSLVGFVCAPSRGREHKPKTRTLAPGNWDLGPPLGFSLFEMLLVMVLLGILTAVAYPSIGRGMATLRLRTASREVAAAVRVARAKALREQQPYYLEFDLEKNEVRLASEDLKYQRSFSLPEGVSFRQVVLLGEKGKSGSKNPIYYFAPNGLGESFEVRLTNDHGREIRVVQDSLSGSPKIEESSPEGRLE